MNLYKSQGGLLGVRGGGAGGEGEGLPAGGGVGAGGGGSSWGAQG